ncbi:hypothetical protein TcasGA2_TC016353 [Tribolium castaneum]|uniref:Uncharacterized protein n=1 Tax=Tribolium castaneum TaxID=7070 RepID=D6WPC1_TRICA|nr:hypothetical protein TcasGA2_TC016353 [Tribolium castaneum]
MRCNFVPAVSVKKMQIVPCISTKTTMALEQNISPILSGIRLIPQTIRYEVYSKLSDFVLGGTQFSIMKDRTINGRGHFDERGLITQHNMTGFAPTFSLECTPLNKRNILIANMCQRKKCVTNSRGQIGEVTDKNGKEVESIDEFQTNAEVFQRRLLRPAKNPLKSFRKRTDGIRADISRRVLEKLFRDEVS